MSLLDWNLSPKDNARVQAVLRDDERVVLVTRPRPQMDIVEAVGRVFSGVMLLVMLAYALCQMQQIWWLVLAFVSPLILFAAWLISSPARYRRQKERTLYLLTDKRVLMLEPKGIFGERVVAYPLQPNPVKAVQHGDDGYGDIIFDYEQHWEIFPKMRHRTTPVGFIEVPEVVQVEQLIAAQVEATPPAVPLPAAQPPTLAGLPTETDSWGNPVATSMQRPVMITLGILFLLFDAVFLVIGILMLRSDARLEKEGVRTMATVLSVRKEESLSSNHHHRSGTHVSIRVDDSSKRSSGYCYFPRLQFVDAAGVVHEFDSSTGSSAYDFPVGHQVEIIYMPQDPTQAQMVDKGPTMGQIFTLIGGLGCVIGAGLLAGGLMIKRTVISH